METEKTNLVKRDMVLGSKRLSNYFWAVLLVFYLLAFQVT
jgi:hypothetical protein